MLSPYARTTTFMHKLYTGMQPICRSACEDYCLLYMTLYSVTERHHIIQFSYPKDEGSRFLQNGGTFYQTTWYHIPEDSKLHSHCTRCSSHMHQMSLPPKHQTIN